MANTPYLLKVSYNIKRCEKIMSVFLSPFDTILQYVIKGNCSKGPCTADL